MTMTQRWQVGPKVLPKEWESLGSFGPDGWCYARKDGLMVIATVATQEEKEWYQVSVSRKKKTPTIQDMIEVKEVFIGENQAVLHMPKALPKGVYAYCLHLFQPLEKGLLPDFKWNKTDA